MTVLVTGGCGFIGSNFIERWTKACEEPVVNLDNLTYAATNRNHSKCEAFYQGDICDAELVEHILCTHDPRAIVHFAAESHVDNSIADPSIFMKTNVLGTQVLLEAALHRQMWYQPHFTFLHVSTDEVYGSLGLMDDAFTEKTPYNPRSPYAASKAAADHIVSAYHHTYGLRTIITHCSNNYGPWQHSEKFIPTVIRKALANEPIPIYGNGSNIRDWIHVHDHCDALIKTLDFGKIGSTYNIGGNDEWQNVRLAVEILEILGKPIDLITYVMDRKGHDFRYAINSQKIMDNVGWKPRVKMADGLKETVEWYIEEGKRA